MRRSSTLLDPIWICMQNRLDQLGLKDLICIESSCCRGFGKLLRKNGTLGCNSWILGFGVS